MVKDKLVKQTRRGFLKTIRDFGIITATAIGLDETLAYNWRRNQRKDFGTVENPTYIVRNLPKLTGKQETDLNNYERFYSHSGLRAKKRELSLKNLTRARDSYYDILNSIEKAYSKMDTFDDEKKARILGMIEQASFELPLEKFRLVTDAGMTNLEDSLNDLQGSVLSKLIGSTKVNFNPYDMGKEVFEALTGENYPSNIKHITEGQRKGIEGYHNPLKGVISSKGLKDLEELDTILHENGHVCAQHQEENLSGWIRRLALGKDLEITGLEEASAYAFVDAGIRYIASKNWEVARLMKVQFESDIKGLSSRYFDGDDSNEHSIGAAYFLATRAAYKDPAKVFNALATIPRSSLDNVPKEVLDQLDELQQKYNIDKNFSSEIERLEKEINVAFDSLEPYFEKAKIERKKMFEESMKALEKDAGIDWHRSN